MPRVPIATHIGKAAPAAVVMLAGVAAMAATAPQPKPETVMKHVLRQVNVVEATEAYQQATYMMTMYHRCPDQFPLSPEKKAFVQAFFDQRGNALRDAMTHAHQRLMQKLPSDAMYVRFAQTIKAEQASAANHLVRLIEAHKTKCDKLPYLKQLDAYTQAQQARAATSASTITESNPEE